MNRLPSLAIAATFALATATSANAGPAEQVWTGAPQHWNSPSVSDCKLLVESVSQARAGQPFEVVTANGGRGMLRYSFSIRVTRAGTEEFRSVVAVARANPGAVSTQSTSTAYNGNLKGAVIGVTLTSCSVVG